MQKPETLFKEINNLHQENLGNAQRTAENAVIIGVKFHQLKELLPHGEFEKSARKSCNVSDQTRCRYMIIAEERLIEQRSIKLLQETNSPGGKSSTMELLADPEMQHIPSEIREQARAQIRADDFQWTAQDIKPKELAHSLEGKDIGDLYRLYNVIREKKPAQHHPIKPLSPEDQVQAENEQAESLVRIAQSNLNLLLHDLQSPTGTLITRVHPKLWKDILRTTIQFNKQIRPLTKRKLSPADKKPTHKSHPSHSTK